MKLGIATDKETASLPKWVDFDMKGYEDNLNLQPSERIAFEIVPKTRATITRAEKLAEVQAKNRSKYEASGAEFPEGSNDQGDRFTRALASILVRDWRNVCDSATEEPLECNDVNKAWLFENLEIAVWIIEEATKLSSRRIEEERKN